jgi:hypothetical protein
MLMTLCVLGEIRHAASFVRACDTQRVGLDHESAADPERSRDDMN